MKVLFISNLFPDAVEPGRGQDNAVLLHELAAQVDLRVLSPRPVLPHRRVGPWTAQWRVRPGDEIFAPVFVPTLYVPRLGSYWNHKLMFRALSRPFHEAVASFSPDVILCSWMFPDGWAAVRLGGEAGLPIVMIAQGSDLHLYMRQGARRRAILEAVGKAAAVITRSRQLSELLQEADVPSPKLHPIYNGVNQEIFKPGNSTEARRKLGLPETGQMLLYVGNFYPVKNPLLLLEAYHRLRSGGAQEESFLVMLGDGPLRAKVMREVDPGGRVLLPGRIGPETVAEYMRAADLLVVPSWNEGVPNVILEAFATGLPVVATEVGGIPEVLDRPFLGRLVPPGNAEAMAAALREVLRQPRCSREIQAHAKQFSWPATAAAYAKLLKGVRA